MMQDATTSRSSRSSIQGVLFDSGDTLVHPIGGEWWPGPFFTEILQAHHIPAIDTGLLEHGLSEGEAYLDANHDVATEEEERKQFEEYYRIVLTRLGLSNMVATLARELGQAAVDRLGIELFPETRLVLETLNEGGLKLGIISNTWPSLERKYGALGIRHFFDVFVISSQFACCKPEDLLFNEAIGQMNLAPERLLFVDDDPACVIKAQQLGLQALLMARGECETSDFDFVTSLDAVVDMAGCGES